jgi:transcriptional regulator with XRE-family HTH domain
LDANRRYPEKKRLNLNLTQSDLEARSGVTQSMLSCVESGDADNVTVGSLRKLAKALNCALVDLLPKRIRKTKHSQLLEAISIGLLKMAPVKVNACINLVYWMYSAVFLLITITLGGCTGTVVLKPEVQYSSNAPLIPAKIAVYFSPEFSAYSFTGEPYNQGYKAVVPVGQASVDVFRKLLPKIFREVIEVSSRKSEKDVVGIIEPSIEAFDFAGRWVGYSKTWASISYRLTVYSQSGDTITSWKETGSGDGPFVEGLSENRAPAVEKAIIDGASQIASSFRDTPEAMRWSRGLPLDGITAPADHQIVTQKLDSKFAKVTGEYAGIVTVTADPYLQFERQKETFACLNLDKVGILAIKLNIKNISSNRLFFDPSNVDLIFSSGSQEAIVQASIVAEQSTKDRPRFPMVSGGTGIAALPLLIFSLANAAATIAEDKERSIYLKSFDSQELKRAYFRGGTGIAGFIYFLIPSDEKYSSLKIPIIDTETATRYIVTLPLSSSEIH